ncbi:hypothetical protein BN1708_018109, partial [Verticillium longisporum]
RLRPHVWAAVLLLQPGWPEDFASRPEARCCTIRRSRVECRVLRQHCQACAQLRTNIAAHYFYGQHQAAAWCQASHRRSVREQAGLPAQR